MRLTKKEKGLILDLLNVASSGWYVDDAILPPGVTSKDEAEGLVKNIMRKITKSTSQPVEKSTSLYEIMSDYRKRNSITNVSGVGIQKP